MFSHFLSNKNKSSSAISEINNNVYSTTTISLQDRVNNESGRSSKSTSGWNFWPSSFLKSQQQKSSSKYNYKDIVQDKYYEQQRHSLIDGPREIEMDLLNHDNCDKSVLDGYPTPPISPSMFILPRCMDEQFFSPVKLVAPPEGHFLRNTTNSTADQRIEFVEEDCELSLVEKFDRISIMSGGGVMVNYLHAKEKSNRTKVRKGF